MHYLDLVLTTTIISPLLQLVEGGLPKATRSEILTIKSSDPQLSLLVIAAHSGSTVQSLNC